MSAPQTVEHTITLINYEPRNGRLPGILAPKILSVTEIRTKDAAADEATVTKTLFKDNNVESDKKVAPMSVSALSNVLALVDELKGLPVQEFGGRDLFGSNTAVEVREGKMPVWGYTPSMVGGCGAFDPEEEEEEGGDNFEANDAHKVEFGRIINSIEEATNASFI
ncbi:hypothetical protein GGF37_000878 [Kickxella alabastrina]|nr:hypothetical protein GGF37_000878 [Kickxella alabastrina]